MIGQTDILVKLDKENIFQHQIQLESNLDGTPCQTSIS